MHGSFNLETYGLDSSHTENDFVASPSTEANARFSPDGKWIAYNSDESGRPEAYVRSYPDNAGRVQISVNGGAKPAWSPDGSRIYFWEGRKMMMATVAREPTLRIMSRQPLFEGDYLPEYDVSRDGNRLLVIESRPSGVELVVIPNWIQELKEKVR